MVLAPIFGLMVINMWAIGKMINEMVEGAFYNKDGKIVTSGIWKKDKLIEEYQK